MILLYYGYIDLTKSFIRFIFIFSHKKNHKEPFKSREGRTETMKNQAIDKMDKKEFGKRLKTLRLKEGYDNQDAIVKALGISKNTYKKWEEGNAIPRDGNLAKLLQLLKADESYFTEKIEAKNPDIQYMCDYTGLTPDSIRALHFLTTGNRESYRDNLEILNFILESEIKRDYKNENSNNILYIVRKCLMRYGLKHDSNDFFMFAPSLLEEGTPELKMKVGDINALWFHQFRDDLIEHISRLRKKEVFPKWRKGIKGTYRERMNSQK